MSPSRGHSGCSVCDVQKRNAARFSHSYWHYCSLILWLVGESGPQLGPHWGYALCVVAVVTHFLLGGPTWRPNGRSISFFAVFFSLKDGQVCSYAGPVRGSSLSKAGRADVASSGKRISGGAEERSWGCSCQECQGTVFLPSPT
jgi:hypothetical protein